MKNPEMAPVKGQACSVSISLNSFSSISPHKIIAMDCPGCKVDEAKALYQGTPIKKLFKVFIVTLCTSLPVSSLFPYLYFMVRDFGIATSEADISTYAGYVGSSYMVGRALTSIAWGMLADRYGRKCAIVVGLSSVVLFNTLFGLSTSFWMAISTRFALGTLNGSLGPIKAYATELFREEHQALGLSMVGSAWGIALVLGPALGGYLAQPVEKYPRVFPKASFFDEFPYFLPCCFLSAFALAALVSCIWLPETLHNHTVSEEAGAIGNSLAVQRNQNLLLNWPLMSNIIVYCVFSLHNTAYTEVFSLWAVSPLKLGGLNYRTNNVGNVLSISGLALMFYNVSLYSFLEKICGALRLSHISAAISIPVLQSYPFATLLSGFTRDLLITVVSILMNCMSISITTGLFLLQNRAVEQHQRGVANGIAMTGMSIFKAIGPAGGGALLSWSQKRLHASFLPGPHMLFFLMNLIAVVGFLMMFNPFLARN